MDFKSYKEELEKKCEKIEEELATVKTKEEKESLEQKIRALYKEIAGEIRELQIIQERIKSTIDKFKKLQVTETEDDTKIMIRSFVQAMTTDTLGSSTYIAEGWNYICAGKYDEAITVLKNALKLDASDLNTMTLLGWAYSYKGMYDEALGICLQVLQKDPENASARNNVGFICYKKGIYGEAIEHLSRVIKHSANRLAVLYAHYYLGLVYLERRMLDDAVFFFSKAIVLGPNLIEAYYHLGITYQMKKMEGAAIEEWKRCLKLSPQNWWAKKAKEQLELGGLDI
ncbi:MAG: tetratricopeptide repeat protein [Candidatus Edwardsbacteria bacterium]